LGASEALARKGVAIAVTVDKERPTIVVNLGAAKRQGMRLAAEVLQLARLLR